MSEDDAKALDDLRWVLAQHRLATADVTEPGPPIDGYVVFGWLYVAGRVSVPYEPGNLRAAVERCLAML